MNKIIFDFDYTLLNAKKYRESLGAIFLKIGVKRKIFEKTLIQARKEGVFYSLERHISLIKKEQPDIKTENLKKVWKKIDGEMKKFVYADSESFLKKIRKKYDIFIVSCGNEKTQKHKIYRSGLSKYFKKILIAKTEEKSIPIRKIIKTAESAIFIDDNPFILMSAKKSLPNLIVVMINRGQGRYAKDKKKYPVDFTIKNFKELGEILENEGFKIK
jgi:FMN phosphatase YigB (HAD superfamily)